MERYEFLSNGWLAAICEEVAGAFLRASEGDRAIAFSFCESSRGVPSHLSATGECGFTVRVKDGRLSFIAAPSEDVTMRVDSDYAAILPVARFDSQGDPAKQAELDGRIAALVGAGSIRLTGDGAGIPAWLPGIHDPMARRTA